MADVTATEFTPYDPADAASVDAGPLALYTVSVDSIQPTQINEGFAESMPRRRAMT